MGALIAKALYGSLAIAAKDCQSIEGVVECTEKMKTQGQLYCFPFIDSVL